MKRCLAVVGKDGKSGSKSGKKIAGKAFYVNSQNKCGCSSGTCTPDGTKGYTSYKITIPSGAFVTRLLFGSIFITHGTMIIYPSTDLSIYRS